MPLFNAGHALVIGVGEYADSTWNVPIAAADAQEIGDTLIDPTLCAYPPGQVKLLTNAAATKEAILAELRSLAGRVRPEDTVLISFTGHGAPGERNPYYLGCYDMGFDGRQISDGTAISMADLGRALRDIPAGRVLLVLNACFSGHAAPWLSRGGIAADRLGAVIDDAASQKLINEASGTERSGRAIITASAANQFSRFMGDQDRSFFGRAFIDALRGGNGGGAASGVISLFDLYTFVHLQTELAVKKATGEPQTPLLTLLQGAGNFAVARYPHAAVLRPEAIQTALPPSVPYREVVRDVITASGDRATAVKAEAGSTVTIDNRQEAPLINFGSNNSVGDIRIGDVVRGNLTKYADGSRSSDNDDTEIEPAKLLPRLAREIAGARNVDASIAASASDEIETAAKALSRGDKARARSKVQEALELLAPLRGNSYVNSKARKLEQVRDVLG